MQRTIIQKPMFTEENEKTTNSIIVQKLLEIIY